ncbi:MAG: pantetheine-phosphate adenylyltransferase [Lawsonibacter sp.]
MKIAIYPGSFDPVTLGHLNIIKRAALCFDKLIVCVMINSNKHGMFTPEERVELLRRSTARFPNVEVDFSDELLAAYAKRRRAHVVVKGLRAVSDFEQEVQMAVINRKLNPSWRPCFWPPVRNTPTQLHHRQGDGPVRSQPGGVRPPGDRGRCEPAHEGIARKGRITMASGVEELLDMLFEMIDEAKNAPVQR